LKNRQLPRWRFFYAPGSTLFNAIRRDVSSFRSCMPTHLVWFRRDLRLQDNLALAAACRDASARVLALYISTPAQWQAAASARLSCKRRSRLNQTKWVGIQLLKDETSRRIALNSVDPGA
ncbi:hypothetical protein AEU03_22550, partial [Salmonella enterica subsp. enterica serovar Muenchen]